MPLALAATLALAPVTAWAASDAPRVGGVTKPAPGARRASCVVQVRSAADMDRVRAELERAGGFIKKRYRWNAYLVSAPVGTDSTAFSRIARAIPGVRSADGNATIRLAAAPNDPYYGFQWGLPAIGWPDSWTSATGAGVAVAVIDTGIDLHHPDLAGRVVDHRNFVAPGTTADDVDVSNDFHGTHVAGVIGAAANNGIYVAGTAPAVTLYAVKVFGPGGTADDAMIADAIRDVVDTTPCRVINMSFGGSTNNAALADAIAYAVSHGVLPVCAAGNDGKAMLFYPAAYAGALGVAAVDSGLSHPSFSNTGAMVDVAAPGVSVLSLMPTDASGWAHTPGQQYMSGTSMATPFVTGVAAQVLSRMPSLTPAQVSSIITATATDLGTAGRDDTFGWGLLRSDRAVAMDVADAFEPDDTTATARVAAAESRTLHTLVPVGDTDHVRVALTAGRTYRMETTDLMIGADTRLTVLATDGVTVLAGNDDRTLGDPSSLVTFTPLVTGDHLVRVDDVRLAGGAYSLVLRDRTAEVGTRRLTAATRPAMAALVAQSAFPGMVGVSHVVLAASEDRALADPLSASGLCGLYGAPLLLTTGASLSSEVSAAIASAPSSVTVHIVGGPATVTSVVESALRAHANVAAVDRIGGADRYAVAAGVAYRMRDVRGARPTAVLIANGQDPTKYFDALALSPVAAYAGKPILLVGYGSVPYATKTAIARLVPSQRIVGGGPATVSNTVYKAVGGTTRWWGADRYYTSAAIANGAIGKGWLRGDRVALAATMHDALVYGASHGPAGDALLVAHPTVLPVPAASYLTARRLTLTGVDVLGPESSISAPVMDAVLARLR